MCKADQAIACEYCKENDCPALDWAYGLDHILPDYRYCPMCGRELDRAVDTKEGADDAAGTIATVSPQPRD